VSATRQKQLVLILARAFASNLSTPTLLADDRGYLVYYNEAAEVAVGKRFSEFGEMPLDEWLEPFAPRDATGELLPREHRPTWIALNDRRPAHLRYMVTSADGVEREIEVSAFPLFAHADEFVGAVVHFWRRLPWLSA
jgi:PAS domain-containing protein